MEIEGRYISNNGQDAENRVFTVTEIREYLENDHIAMLHLNGYTIDGKKYIASALTLSKEHGIPEERDGKLYVPAYFRRFMLATRKEGNPDDLVQVECEIENDDLYISVVKGA